MKTISSQKYSLELIHYRILKKMILSQTIVIDYETDASSDVDDLSEVSMTSARGISKQEFQGLLSDIAAQHQRMAASIDALASRVEDMSIEQVEEAAVRVTSEVDHMRGLEEIIRGLKQERGSVDTRMWRCANTTNTKIF